MSTVAIIGRGPSKFSILSNFDPTIRDVILINNHSQTISNDRFVSLMSNNDIRVHIISNISKDGFDKSVFNKLKINL